jgi:hypothetical protein
MIITIFILIYFNWIILKFRGFYKNILEIENNKYYLFILSIPSILKVYKFTQIHLFLYKSFQLNIFYLYGFFYFSTVSIYLYIPFISGTKHYSIIGIS